MADAIYLNVTITPLVAEILLPFITVKSKRLSEEELQKLSNIERLKEIFTKISLICGTIF